MFGSTVSQNCQKSSNSSSKLSTVSNLETKRVDAAAKAVVKQAAYDALLEESRQKERIKQLEEQHKKVLDVELEKLERMQAQGHLRAAQAKLEVYSQEVEKERDNLFKEESVFSQGS